MSVIWYHRVSLRFRDLIPKTYLAQAKLIRCCRDSEEADLPRRPLHRLAGDFLDDLVQFRHGIGLAFLRADRMGAAKAPWGGVVEVVVVTLLHRAPPCRTSMPRR